MSAPRALVGTAKQVEWAARIRQQMERRLGPRALPDIGEARFWIDARECDTIAELAEAARAFVAERDAAFESPFSDLFPRYGRAEAVAALQGLQAVARSVGVVVLDLETTGLEKEDRVIELAAVRWPSREVVADTLVRPPEGMAPVDISAIDPLALAQAPAFADIAEKVSRWGAAFHLVSWNTRFDVPFLRREIARSDPAGAPPLRATCAMRLTSAWLRLDRTPSLEDAAAWLDIEVAGPAHRAMPDVLTTCALLDRMAEGVAR